MTGENIPMLVLALVFVVITLMGSVWSYRIFKIRMAHEEKVYAQRETLIDLLTKHDKQVVDEEVQRWLDEHRKHLRRDVEEQMERAYGDAIRSIMKDATRPQGGSHGHQPVQPD